MEPDPVNKRHISVIYSLFGVYILLYGFYNLEEGAYSIDNMNTALGSIMVVSSLSAFLLYGGNNHDIVWDSVTKPSDLKNYVGLWLILLTFVSIFVSGITLLNANPYGRYSLECPDLEFLMHVPGSSPACVPCNPCNYTKASCNLKTGACVCDDDGADPSMQCNACFDGFSLESGCTECRNNYNVDSFCTRCDVGWSLESDCTTCAEGWTGANCDACLPDYFGNPAVSCAPCDCDFGDCDNNERREATFNPSVCTRTARTCSISSDCADSGNCAGRCRSRLQSPGRAEVEEYENKVCRDDSDCGADVDFYFGECIEKACCEEFRFGTGDCLNCPPGRQEPRCALCPGYDATYDTYCNGHGTCVGTGLSAVCACETGYSGVACERGPDFTCVSGFFGTNCDACPGVVNMNGLSACNIKSGNAKECSSSGACVCATNKFYKFTGPSCEDCMPGYAGENCLRCPGWDINDVNASKVCGGHGTCIADEFGRPSCQCDDGYLIDPYLSCA